jgi:hypothetical protein
VAELGCDHHLVTEGGKGFADEFFVGERTLGLGGIVQGDASVHGGPNEGDHFLPVSGWAVVGAHAQAAEPDSGNLQVAVSKFALLHVSSPQRYDRQVVSSGIVRR